MGVGFCPVFKPEVASAKLDADGKVLLDACQTLDRIAALEPDDCLQSRSAVLAMRVAIGLTMIVVGSACILLSFVTAFTRAGPCAVFAVGLVGVAFISRGRQRLRNP